MRRLIVSTAMVSLLVATAGRLEAQSDQQQIERVHAQALVLQQDQSRLVPAARLYVREAKLRGPEDPESVKCLTTAAHLLYYAGRHPGARRVMEQAAEAALERGDVLGSADIYLLAAWMAQTDGKKSETARLAHRAQLLAGSPLLASQESAALLTRVRHVSTISAR